MKTYLVEYSYSYDYKDEEGRTHHKESTYDSYVQCKEDDIKEEIIKLIQEDEMDDTSSNLNVAILFYYCPTTYDDF